MPPREISYKIGQAMQAGAGGRAQAGQCLDVHTVTLRGAEALEVSLRALRYESRKARKECRLYVVGSKRDLNTMSRREG